MLRSWSSLFCASMLLAGCGGEVTSLPPEDDAGFTNDSMTPTEDIFTGVDASGTDTGSTQPADTGSFPPPPPPPPPRDSGFPTPGLDSGTMGGTDGGGMGTGGVCPSMCRVDRDCDPCWRVGEMRVGNYCCTSGLCIYSAGMCSGGPPPPPPPGGGGADGGLLRDAGGAIDGGGGVGRDGGTGGRDGGGAIDAGTGGRDAGTIGRDAGTGGRDVALGRG